MSEPQGPRRQGDVWMNHPEMGHVVWTGERWVPFSSPDSDHPLWAKAATGMFLIPLAIIGLLAILDLFVWVWRITWRLLFG